MENKPANCVCDLGKFCKYHYSALYYERNKKDILAKQKNKYKEKKQKEHIWALTIGDFSPFGVKDTGFGKANQTVVGGVTPETIPTPELVRFFGRV